MPVDPTLCVYDQNTPSWQSRLTEESRIEAIGQYHPGTGLFGYKRGLRKPQAIDFEKRYISCRSNPREDPVSESAISPWPQERSSSSH